MVAGATVTTSTALVDPLFSKMQLFPTRQEAETAFQCSRTVWVKDMREGGNRYWADPDQVAHSTMPGLIRHRNRAGVVIGAMLVAVEEPTTARYISASAAGALRVQKLQCGHECYGLTNAAGAIIGG
jgi:hypothetical protein